MEINFKRTFLGYSPVKVKNLINSMDSDYEGKLKVLRKQFAASVSDIEQLKVEIQKVRDQINSYRSLENEISRLFLKTHLEATEKVYAAALDAGRADKKAAEMVQSRKAELIGLKATIEKVKEEILYIANQHRTELKKAEGE